MSGLLLDTSAYSAYRKGEEQALEALATADCVHMSTIVLGELYFGFRNGSRQERNIEELRQFRDKPVVRTADITDATAKVYAGVFLDLKRRGTPIPLNDVWIAAQCLELGSL